MDTLDQPTEAHEKIYNLKSNRIIAINGQVYRKLLLNSYMHWREERLLIPPLHELPILKRYTVAHKRNATDYFLTLKAYNLPTTSAKVIILYLF